MKIIAPILLLVFVAGCACTPIPANSTADVAATYHVVRQLESLYWLILVLAILGAFQK